jgi:hypothetical protein
MRETRPQYPVQFRALVAARRHGDSGIDSGHEALGAS